MNSICFDMAVNDLKSSKRDYRAYFTINSLTVAFIYLFCFIANNKGLNEISGGRTIKLMLFLGIIGVGIFAAIFQFYINGFMMKRRQKSYGLYSILGLEKKHIVRIVLHQSVILYLVSAAAGLVLGVIFGKGAFSALLKLMRCTVPIDNAVTVKNILITCVIYFITSLAVYIYNAVIIYRTGTLSLLRAESRRQTKTRFRAVFDAVLGAGLVIFSAVKLNSDVSVFSSLNTFFVMVLLLLLGTYLVYGAASWAVLTLMKHSDGIYYSKNRFFAVSNTLHRNTQTSVGFASICMILTVVSIIMTTTVSLYTGTEQQVQDAYTYDGYAYLSDADYADREEISAAAERIAGENGVTAEDLSVYDVLSYSMTYTKNDGLAFVGRQGSELALLDIMTLDDMNMLNGTSLALNEGEVYAVSENGIFTDDSITIGGKTFSVRQLDSFALIEREAKNSTINDVYIFVRDRAVMDDLMQSINSAEGRSSIVNTYVEFGTAGNDGDRQAFEDAFREYLAADSSVTLESFETKHKLREEYYARNSVYLFLGFFLSMLFVCLMLVVMYNKQMQEAADDRKKFVIMRKIGCSKPQCRRMIFTQSALPYFAPILIAGGYSAVMYRTIKSVLKIFMLGEASIIIKCMFVTFGIVFAVYAAGYFVANHVYSKTVLENTR